MCDATLIRLSRYVGGARSTLLHTAAYNGRSNIVAELLLRKADVNARNVVGHTPLYDCVDNRGTVEIAKMLLDAGADVTIASNRGKTPLQQALDKGRADLADLLKP